MKPLHSSTDVKPDSILWWLPTSNSTRSIGYAHIEVSGVHNAITVQSHFHTVQHITVETGMPWPEPPQTCSVMQILSAPSHTTAGSHQAGALFLPQWVSSA